MPRQTMVIDHNEHAEVMAAVGGQNGLNVTSVGIYHEGKLVAYDEVRLEVDGMSMSVRSVPEDTPSEMYRKVREAQMWKLLNGDVEVKDRWFTVQEVEDEEATG